MQTGPYVYATYPKKTALGLGITQVIVGVLLIIFNILSAVYYTAVSASGYGFWGGIFVSNHSNQPP